MNHDRMRPGRDTLLGCAAAIVLLAATAGQAAIMRVHVTADFRNDRGTLNGWMDVDQADTIVDWEISVTDDPFSNGTWTQLYALTYTPANSTAHYDPPGGATSILEFVHDPSGDDRTLDFSPLDLRNANYPVVRGAFTGEESQLVGGQRRGRGSFASSTFTPEPATSAILGVGGVVFLRRRRALASRQQPA